MRAKYFASLVFSLLIVFAVTQLQLTSYAQPEIEVELIDQFDYSTAAGLQPKHGVVKEIAFFANPVRKLHESGNLLAEIKDKGTHLTWYKLEQKEPYAERTVRFTNQFGKDQEWVIGKPVYLLVPTDKIGEHLPPRDEMKHFKCYEVLQPVPLEEKVILQDQFDEGNNDVVEVMRAAYFCTPVIKNGKMPEDGDIDKFLKGKHLACYWITRQEIDKDVMIQNQFDDDKTIDLEESVMLCVPSDKID